MGKSLIITEKPSVARDFAKVLDVSGSGRGGYMENSEYVITWCVGHLVGLVYPEVYDAKYKKWRLEDLPFLPEDYIYDVIPSVKNQYDVVHRMLHREDISRVYWAGDAGKEGQTIEENIRHFGGVREGMEELRVWIDSQTEEEILRGIRQARPMSDYANLGKSGTMRTIEDYAMGINFSRALSVKYGRMLNDAAGTKSYAAIAVGRVMTCVLGMVVIREREIRDFKETPFYRVTGTFLKQEIKSKTKQVLHDEAASTDVAAVTGGAQDADGNGFANPGIICEWKAVEGSKYYGSPYLYKENGFKKRETADELIEFLEGKPAIVERVEKGTSRKKAPLLFNLAELQAECAKRFKISPDQTLAAAQELYEKKLTTYPRTDARVLSSAVAKEIHKNIGGLRNYEPTAAFAADILDNQLYKGIAKTQYVNDAKVTDHYAIIPTGQTKALSSLTSLQKSVFELIVRRFLSIFYPPAEYATAKLTVRVENEMFFASAKALVKEGYLAVASPQSRRMQNNKSDTVVDSERAQEGESDSAAVLEAIRSLRKGSKLTVEGYAVKEGKTSPPKRYTSGSMVLAMENAGQLIEDEELREQIKGSGIGTSATRAEIIQKLVRIGYLDLNKKTQVLTPKNFGEMVYEVVNLTAPALLNPKMTASWEKGLDGITRGTVEYTEYRGKLEDFIRTETLAMVNRDLTRTLSERIRPFSQKKAGTGNSGGSVNARRKAGSSYGGAKAGNRAGSTYSRQPEANSRGKQPSPEEYGSDEAWEALMGQL